MSELVFIQTIPLLLNNGIYIEHLIKRAISSRNKKKVQLENQQYENYLTDIQNAL